MQTLCVRVLLGDDCVRRFECPTHMTVTVLLKHVLQGDAENKLTLLGWRRASATSRLVLVRHDRELGMDERLGDCVRSMDILELVGEQPAVTATIDCARHRVALTQLQTEAPPRNDYSEEPHDAREHATPSTPRKRRNALVRKPWCGRVTQRFHRSLQRCAIKKTAPVAPLRLARLPKRRKSSAASAFLDQKLPPGFLLSAGFQLIDRLAVLQSETQHLLLLMRDAKMRSGTCAVQDVLPALLRMARATEGIDKPPSFRNRKARVKPLTFRLPGTMLSTSDGNGTVASEMEHSNSDSNESSKANDTKMLASLNVGSTLSPMSTRQLGWNNGGVGSIVEGWVVCAEWTAIWRNQRKEYACLCDDSQLYFFATKEQAEDYLFELSRERKGSLSDVGKKIMKDMAPQSRIDLTAPGWRVRKGDMAKEERHAFALVDPAGKMRLIVDVDTLEDAQMWIAAIASEIKQNELLHRVQQLQTKSNSEEKRSSSAPARQGATIQQFQQALECGRFEVPLRWLYAKIDRVNGQARHERMRCATLSQALKDLQRDRVKINGVLYKGSSIEEIITALMLAIPTEPHGHRNSNGATTWYRSLLHSTSALSSNEARSSNYASQMHALQFARRLLICSARTHGGGDILDTLHLMLRSDHFCICPDSYDMEPIEIQISNQIDPHGNKRVPVADIKMRMVYRIVEQHDEEQDPSGSNHVDDGGKPKQRPAQKVAAVYHQTLVCSLKKWKEVHGSVCVEFLIREREQ